MGRTLRPSAALAAAFLLPLLGCIEDRLAVDVTTQVFADGSCQRRVEYRLERVDTEGGKARPVEIPEAEDPFRLLHRFPAGEAWSVMLARDGTARTAVAEAALSSPALADGDYWRAPLQGTRPARNFVSFAVSGPEARRVYDYAEVFRDPSSPLAAAQLMVKLLRERDGAFADGLEAALGEGQAPKGAVKRAWRDFADAFARRLAALAARPLFGPGERRELDQLVERASWDDLRGRLQALVPSLAEEDLGKAVDASAEALWPAVEREMEAAGMPAALVAPELAERRARTRFRVTLVMPAPITRANTCVNGDTAVWEFEGDELFGRGFEMRARAEVP